MLPRYRRVMSRYCPGCVALPLSPLMTRDSLQAAPNSARIGPFFVTQGIHNLRDYGGYAILGGGRVRSGVLFRSGQHMEASDEDLALIDALVGEAQARHLPFPPTSPVLQIITGFDAETLKAVFGSAPVQAQTYQRRVDGAGVEQPAPQLLLAFGRRLAAQLEALAAPGDTLSQSAKDAKARSRASWAGSSMCRSAWARASRAWARAAVARGGIGRR